MNIMCNPDMHGSPGFLRVIQIESVRCVSAVACEEQDLGAETNDTFTSRGVDTCYKKGNACSSKMVIGATVPFLNKGVSWGEEGSVGPFLPCELIRNFPLQRWTPERKL
jgi:hypothetical protein